MKSIRIISIVFVCLIVTVSCYIFFWKEHFFPKNQANFSNRKTNIGLRFSKDSVENVYLGKIVYGHNMDSIIFWVNNDIKNGRYYFFKYGLGDSEIEDIVNTYARKKYNLHIINAGDLYGLAGADHYNKIMVSFLQKKVPKSLQVRNEALIEYDRINHTQKYAYLYQAIR